MIECSHPAPRPVLVAASDTSDASLARSAIEELGSIPVLVQDAAEAIRHLSDGPRRYAALVTGERIGRISGFTLCGVARDAGCRLPMLLLTRDACRWTAVRAARLQVSVLWQPVPAYRIAQTLSAMLPSRPCGDARRIKLPAWPQAIPGAATPVGAASYRGGWERHCDRWRQSRGAW
jgi:DNA-binding NtrC family response regulator